MKIKRSCLNNKKDNDQDWIKELSLDSYFVNYYDLTDRDIKLIYDLYIDYQMVGFERKAAMKKALLVFDSFEF